MALEFGDSLDGFTLFVGPNDYGGMVTKGKIVMPKRTLKARRPGGTNMPIKTHHGWELENYNLGLSGVSSKLFSVMNGRRIDQQQLLIRGAYTDEWTGNSKTLELEIWGRTEENDLFGELETEEDSEGTVDIAPVIANCTYGGQVVFRYNARTGVVIIGEDDETESIRIALGRS